MANVQEWLTRQPKNLQECGLVIEAALALDNERTRECFALQRGVKFQVNELFKCYINENQDEARIVFYKAAEATRHPQHVIDFCKYVFNKVQGLLAQCHEENSTYSDLPPNGNYKVQRRRGGIISRRTRREASRVQ